MARQKPILAIVGLGYVGLPLAAAFSRAGYKVIGFDTSQNRIQELQSGIDTTQELSPKEVQSLTDIDFTAQETALQNAENRRAAAERTRRRPSPRPWRRRPGA